MAKTKEATDPEPITVGLMLLDPPPMAGHAELMEWLGSGGRGMLFLATGVLDFEPADETVRGNVDATAVVHDVAEILVAAAETAREDRPVRFTAEDPIEPQASRLVRLARLAADMAIHDEQMPWFSVNAMADMLEEIQGRMKAERKAVREAPQ